jgi:hypothetical protein
MEWFITRSALSNCSIEQLLMKRTRLDESVSPGANVTDHRRENTFRKSSEELQAAP